MTTDLKRHLQRAQSDIADALGNSAKEYFDLGMGLYQDRRKYPYRGFQAILGNLAVSVELLIKCIVARRMFPLLYEGLGREAQAILTFPEQMPDGTMPNSFLGDLRSFSQKAIDLNQSVSYFYLLYPKLKQEYSPHLKLLAAIRNVSLHGAVPSFQLYHLERVAYIACKLFLLAKDENLLRWYFIKNENVTKSVVEKFDEQRIAKVHKAIENAKNKSKSLEYLRTMIFDGDEWERRTESCPVCKNEAHAYGYTEADEDEDGTTLWFYKDQFECEECGLALDDVAELELAGLDVMEDISNYLEEWLEFNDEARR